MRFRVVFAILLFGVFVFGVLAIRPAPAQDDSPVPMPPVVIGAPPPPIPHLTDQQTIQNATDDLQNALHKSVPHLLTLPQGRKQQIVDMVAQALHDHGRTIDHAQMLVAVDRNPRQQELALIMAQPDGPWRILGATHVSTGQANRKLYYITPTGVFPHDGTILDYRAEGTFNENHIRGLGLKGMRVWDFGWQWANKGWLTSGEKGQIRLEMHATDPEFLEQRLGKPASEGCVRIPALWNRFLDYHGVLDADYEQRAETDPQYRGVLLHDREPTPLAGDLLVVVDSGAGSGL
jgi:hypothetical protein